MKLAALRRLGAKSPQRYSFAHGTDVNSVVSDWNTRGFNVSEK
jgi:hypothetical protein